MRRGAVKDICAWLGRQISHGGYNTIRVATRNTRSRTNTQEKLNLEVFKGPDNRVPMMSAGVDIIIRILLYITHAIFSSRFIPFLGITDINHLLAYRWITTNCLH